MLGYFKVQDNDSVIQISKKFVVSGLIGAFLAIIPSLYIFLQERQRLNSNYSEFLEKKGGYWLVLSSDKEVDKNVRIKEYIEETFLTPRQSELLEKGFKAEGTGIRLDINKCQFKKDRILYDRGYAYEVKYKKDLFRKEQEEFEVPNRYALNDYGEIEFVPAEIKKRAVIVRTERTSVKECFDAAKKYLLDNELLSKGFRKLDVHTDLIRDKINGQNEYYRFESDKDVEGDDYSGIISNDEWEIEIKRYAFSDKLTINWKGIMNLVFFMFLLLFTIPFFYFVRCLILKAR